MMLVPARSLGAFSTTRLRPLNYRRVGPREFYGRGMGLGAVMAHRPATRLVFLTPRAIRRGLTGVLEDAEASAAASGLCMDCKSQDVCFPFVDPATGKSCYTENICAPCGTEDYSYMANLIALPGGGQVLAGDLARASVAGATAASYTSTDPAVQQLQQQAAQAWQPVLAPPAAPPPSPPAPAPPAAETPARPAPPTGQAQVVPPGAGDGTPPVPLFSFASLLTGKLVDGIPNWALAAGLLFTGMLLKGRG